MKRNLFWKFLLILFVVGWSLWEMFPLTPRNLVDEFENRVPPSLRDTNFTAMVAEARKLDQANPQRTYANLQMAIGTNDISRYFPAIKVTDPKESTRAILHRLQADAAGRVKLGLDLQGGSSFLVGIDTNKLAETEAKDRILDQAVEVLRKRVDKFGVAEPIIQPAGANRIMIQLPGLSEAEKESAKTQISKVASLEFRLVHAESDELIKQGAGAAGYEVLTVKSRSRDGQETVYPYLVRKKAERGLTGKYVRRAYPTTDQVTGEPQIILNFDDAGAKIFGEITRDNVGRQLAIVLDGELYSAPRINEPIMQGSAQISGNFDLKEAWDLANVLENPLEAPVAIEQEMSVEPSLGRDSIDSGVKASIAAAVGTFVFMLIFYFFGGLVANLALFLNVVILMGVMCSLNATLTLPGIAGIALTIGMAVDANVLIFERLREELLQGKSLRGAVAAGYNKAFGAIFDSNLTTVISAIILINLGAGPVKGFGVTLTIGVCASMYTALIVTRLIFDFLLERGWIKSLRMLPVFHPPKIDFIKWAKPLFTASWVLIAIGIGYGISRGKGVLAVDFAGGDALTMSFAQKVEVDKLRQALDQAGIADSQIQYSRSLAEGNETLNIVTPINAGDKAAQALVKAFPQAKLQVVGSEKVGASVGAEIQRTAVVASLLALFAILVYVALRYELSFAFGAVIAVVHDVLLTMGLYFATGRQLSGVMVAAILTIIGYSINDKIVNLDRIREDLKLGVRGSFRELINIALNQTLSRTVITGGSVILATLALYLFGGGVINDFAFTFLVGTIVGTYSSLFIASPIVLWWNKGERPRASSQVVMDNTVTARV